METNIEQDRVETIEIKGKTIGIYQFFGRKQGEQSSQNKTTEGTCPLPRGVIEVLDLITTKGQ